MSIWVTLEMTVNQGDYDLLSDFLATNLPNTRGFDGAEMVTLFYSRETRALLIQEEWLSVDHHKAYLKFIQDNGVMGELLSFMETPPKVRYYEKLPL